MVGGKTGEAGDTDSEKFGFYSEYYGASLQDYLELK